MENIIEQVLKGPKVLVIDSMMGTGKTNLLINLINDLHKQNIFNQFVYISPNNSEVGDSNPNSLIKGRIPTQCSNVNFRSPEIINGRKSTDLENLIVHSNVSATHNLFKRLDPHNIETFVRNKNILIIDEELDIICPYDITKADLQFLKDRKAITLGDKGQIQWDEQCCAYDESKFSYKEFATQARQGNLYLINNGVVVWRFNPEILKAFDKVIIATYMFDASIMAQWCKMHDVTYNRIVSEQLEEKQLEAMEDALRCINLLSIDKCIDFPLSQTWFRSHRRNAQEMDVVKTKLINVKKNYLLIENSRSKIGDTLFTCPKESIDYIRGERFKKAEWLANSCKATNNYSHKWALMYVLNKYPNTYVKSFLHENGYPLDENQWSLAQLLQWVYRSRIRNGEPIALYIASRRMHRLFTEWKDTLKHERNSV